MGNCTAYRIRPTTDGVDRYNDPVAGDPTRTLIPDAMYAPGATADLLENLRDGATVDATLYHRYGFDLVTTDLVEVDGTPFRVEGHPSNWQGLSGWQAGQAVLLRRAEG